MDKITKSECSVSSSSWWFSELLFRILSRFCCYIIQTWCMDKDLIVFNSLQRLPLVRGNKVVNFQRRLLKFREITVIIGTANTKTPILERYCHYTMRLTQWKVQEITSQDFSARKCSRQTVSLSLSLFVLYIQTAYI